MPLRARQTSRHLQGEKNICHLFWFLMIILFSFLQELTKTGKPNNSAEQANEFKATAILPYVKGLSEQLRRCLQQQGVRAVFKSETCEFELPGPRLITRSQLGRFLKNTMTSISEIDSSVSSIWKKLSYRKHVHHNPSIKYGLRCRAKIKWRHVL